MKKLFSILLTVLMSLCVFTVNVTAEGDPAPENVAEVNGTGYPTLADAITAVLDDGTETTIIMIKDINCNFAGENEIVIPSNKNVVLDLNGYTITAVGENNGASYYIYNKGTLTIKDSKDSGLITYNSKHPDKSYGYGTSTILNRGVLTIENGTIKNTTNDGASYAVDNQTLWYDDISPVDFNLKGGIVECTSGDAAIRQAATLGEKYKKNGEIVDNVINIIDGKVIGDIWIQSQAVDNVGSHSTLNISGGEITGKVYDTLSGNGDNLKYNFTGGYIGEINMHRESKGSFKTSFVHNGYFKNEVLNSEVETGKECIKVDDLFNPSTEDLVAKNAGYIYTVGKKQIARIGDVIYPSLAQAIENVNENETIVMLRNTTEEVVIKNNKKFTLDLAGYTLTGSIALGGEKGSDNFETPAYVTIVDNSDSKTGKILNPTADSYAIYAYGSSKLDIDGIKIECTNSALYSDALYMVGDRNANGSVKTDFRPTVTIKDTTMSTKSGDSDKGSPAIFCIDGELTISGKTVITAENGSGVQSLGTFGNNDITINDSTIINADKAGIYLPFGNLTINGGEITGATGVWVKGAYKTFINGGTIKGTAQKASYEYKESGIVHTGDGFVVEACNFGGHGNPEVWINGGMFTSVNAKPVAYYSNGGNKIVNTNEKFISGGWFSTEAVPSAYIVDGYKASGDLRDKGAPNTTNVYTVVKDVPLDKLENRKTSTITNDTGNQVQTEFGTSVVKNPTLSTQDSKKIENISVSNLNEAINADAIKDAANKLDTEGSVEVNVLMNVDVSTVDAVKSLSDKISQDKGVECNVNKDVEFIDISVNKIVKTGGQIIEVSLIKTTVSHQYITLPLKDVLGDNVDPERVFVYRNHKIDDTNEENTPFTKVEKDYGPSYNIGEGECYWIDGNNLVIKAKNFSVYGIGQQTNTIPAEKKPTPGPLPRYIVPNTKVGDNY